MARARVLYYLGAGASANALPVVDEIPERFGLFLAIARYRYVIGGANSELIERFLTAIIAVCLTLKRKRSIDTYAKELWLRNEKINIYDERLRSINEDNIPKTKNESITAYNLLKSILAFYFIWLERRHDRDFIEDISMEKLIDYFDNHEIEFTDTAGGYEIEHKLNAPSISYPVRKDIIKMLKEFDKKPDDKKPIDDRYVNFLTDVLERGTPTPKFPKDKIKIISWNYDNQFELACRELNMDKDFYNNEINPNLHQINGKFHRYDEFKFLQLFDVLGDILKDSGINFAWEKDKYKNFDKEVEEKIGKDSFNHIVIIGYSFPFANREIDRMILNRYGWRRNLKTRKIDSIPDKVYVVVPNEEEFNNIKERIMSLADITDGDRIIHITDTKNFFIPNIL
ncbi:MAG: hypothetical protein ACR2NY_02850 [Alphaproteobacteria bacterium]